MSGEREATAVEEAALGEDILLTDAPAVNGEGHPRTVRVVPFSVSVPLDQPRLTLRWAYGGMPY